MDNFVSALASMALPFKSERLHIREVQCANYLISAWAASLGEVQQQIAVQAGLDQPLAPNMGAGSVLRVEPLKYWWLQAPAPTLEPAAATVLDQSHSKAVVIIEGEASKDLLNRCIPIDLRDSAFNDGALASTVFHHVGVTVWRQADVFWLFMPRTYAQFLTESLLEIAQSL
ncbi:MAG: hypothetical protein HWE20_03775 [Gammaproteobacteria bacterium]|nr:hypothetical protein [Gammaproteobacteria bacterium]